MRSTNLKYLIELKIAGRPGSFLIESGTTVNSVTGRFQAAFSHDFKVAHKSSTINSFSDAERFAKRVARRLISVAGDVEYRVVAATEKGMAPFDWKLEVGEAA